MAAKSATRQEEKNLLARHATRRWSRVGMYLLVTAAGVVMFGVRGDLEFLNISPTRGLLWSGALISSAFVCFLGSLFDRWIGEFSALPLLVCVFGLFGVTAVDASGNGRPVLFAFGILVIAFGFGLFARWRDVQAIKNATRRRN